MNRKEEIIEQIIELEIRKFDINKDLTKRQKFLNKFSLHSLETLLHNLVTANIRTYNEHEMNNGPHWFWGYIEDPFDRILLIVFMIIGFICGFILTGSIV